jgi:hypothetical protein
MTDAWMCTTLKLPYQPHLCQASRCAPCLFNELSKNKVQYLLVNELVLRGNSICHTRLYLLGFP